MKLTEQHLKLHKAIVKRGIGKCCNDLLPEEHQILSREQWIELCKNYHDWNGEPEEFDPNRPIMFDFMVVDFLNHIMYEKVLEK
jgi:hypothetical protein